MIGGTKLTSNKNRNNVSSQENDSWYFSEKPALRTTGITVELTNSGINAQYTTYTDGIKIKWQNPVDAKYKLFLFNGDDVIYAGGHVTKKADLSFGSENLSGTEILSGYFKVKNSVGEYIQTLPTFYLDLNMIAFNSSQPPVTETIGGNENRITYSFKNFNTSQEGVYRAFLRRVFPILYEKLGPPAENFNCVINGNGSFYAFYSDKYGRKMITDGSFLPQTIVHEFIHAWKGHFLLSSDSQWKYTTQLMGFEEGSAHGMAFEIIHEYVKSYPNDEATYIIMGDKTGQYWDLTTNIYDLIKRRRYLGGGDLWNGGLQSDRYSVAGTTFQIMEVENPSFYKQFMKKYYEKINIDPNFHPLPENLIKLMSEVNSTFNGIPTEKYLLSLPVFQGHKLDKGMYVINKTRNLGVSSLNFITASYAHKDGDLFWSIPTDRLENYQIPSWVPYIKQKTTRFTLICKTSPL